MFPASDSCEHLGRPWPLRRDRKGCMESRPCNKRRRRPPCTTHSGLGGAKPIEDATSRARNMPPGGRPGDGEAVRTALRAHSASGGRAQRATCGSSFGRGAPGSSRPERNLESEGRCTRGHRLGFAMLSRWVLDCVAPSASGVPSPSGRWHASHASTLPGAGRCPGERRYNGSGDLG